MSKGVPDLGEKIKRLRTIRGMEQLDLAQKAGVTQSYISKIELGVVNPSLKALKKIALALGIEAEELFHNTKPSPDLDEERMFLHLSKNLRQFLLKDDSPPFVEFARELHAEGYTEEELEALKLIAISRNKRKNIK